MGDRLPHEPVPPIQQCKHCQTTEWHKGDECPVRLRAEVERLRGLLGKALAEEWSETLAILKESEAAPPPRDVEAEARALGWWQDDVGDWYSKRGQMTWGSEAWEPKISCGPGGWVGCASRHEALAYALDHREVSE